MKRFYFILLFVFSSVAVFADGGGVIPTSETVTLFDGLQGSLAQFVKDVLPILFSVGGLFLCFWLGRLVVKQIKAFAYGGFSSSDSQFTDSEDSDFEYVDYTELPDGRVLYDGIEYDSLEDLHMHLWQEDNKKYEDNMSLRDAIFDCSYLDYQYNKSADSFIDNPDDFGDENDALYDVDDHPF